MEPYGTKRAGLRNSSPVENESPAEGQAGPHLGSVERHPRNCRTSRSAAADARYDGSPSAQRTLGASLGIVRQQKYVVVDRKPCTGGSSALSGRLRRVWARSILPMGSPKIFDNGKWSAPIHPRKRSCFRTRTAEYWKSSQSGSEASSTGSGLPQADPARCSAVRWRPGHRIRDR
jgi:hypothetical protein